jgi:hypothetical protein
MMNLGTARFPHLLLTYQSARRGLAIYDRHKNLPNDGKL